MVPRRRANSDADAVGPSSPRAGGSVRMSSARSTATTATSRSAASRGDWGGAGAGVPLSQSAATSHIANDAYMNDFEEAYTSLYGADIKPAASMASALAIARYSSRRETLLLKLSGRELPASLPAARGAQLPSASWSSSGPSNAEGTLVDISDRPLLVAARDPRASSARCEVIVGGADHALYAIDTMRGAMTRRLYGGRTGHTEWVTGVSFLGDGSGRVASCAMDGRVCIWGAGGSARAPPPCAVLDGAHFGSITTVAAPGGGTAAGGPASTAAAHLLVTAGYDKTVKLWDSRQGAGAAVAATLTGHEAPILSLALRAQDATATFSIASGDRSGSLRIWDGSVAAPVGTLSGHKGHVTAVAWYDELVISGAQDGCVRVWDPRTSAPVANIPAHASDAGSGAVGDIVVCGGTSSGERSSTTTRGLSQDQSSSEATPLVVTAGADKRLCVLDPRAGWNVRSTLKGHRDFIYSLTVVGGVALSGAGDGLMIAHDVSTGKTLWGVGANTAAVRCIVPVLPEMGRQTLVAAGDDGKALIYDM